MVSEALPPDLAETLDLWLSDADARVEGGPFALLAWLHEIHMARLSADEGIVVSRRATACTDVCVTERGEDWLTMDVTATFEHRTAHLDGIDPPRLSRSVTTALEWRRTSAGWLLWDEEVEGVWRSALACVGRVGGRRGPLRCTRVGALTGREPMVWVEFANDTDTIATINERAHRASNSFRDWAPRPSELATLLMLPPRTSAVLPVEVAEFLPGWQLSYFGEVNPGGRHLERLDVSLSVDSEHLAGRGWCTDSRYAAEALASPA